MQEERLHLVDTPRRDEDKVEDGEQPKLQRECTISNLPESETAKETSKDMEDDFVPHVVLQLVSPSILCLSWPHDLPEIAIAGSSTVPEPF